MPCYLFLQNLHDQLIITSDNYIAMISGWAELNFEHNLYDSSSTLSAAAAASRQSVISAPPLAGSSSSALLSQRSFRSALPFSVRLVYLLSVSSHQFVRPNVTNAI